MIKNVGKKFLSDIKLHSDYLRWDNNNDRYETWEEAIEAILTQHVIKYKNVDITNELDYIRPYLYDKKVLASQRNLQFRGEEIFKHNTRLFNCSSLYIDRTEVFKQVIYLLLSGCGVGFSVERRFVQQLPTVKRRTNNTVTYDIEDSIEGWSLALDELMMSYFEGKDKIRFNYSNIRPKNALIAGRFLAPGPEPLKKALEIIENILDNLLGTEREAELSPIECYDIICHSSDAVLSAGVRRSALIALFDKDDDDMINAKTGDWYITNPQRARSNNSVKLIKDRYTKEEYDYFANKVKEYGEPGIALVDDERFCTNPLKYKEFFVSLQ
jgi:ribonucleoside-triphosphate reductase